MNSKKVGFLCGIAFSLLPVLSFASNIHLWNQTNSPLTGGSGFVCSSNTFGSLGPGDDVDIKQSDVEKLCPFGTCKVDIYMNKGCDGDSISTIKVNKKDGVTGISNHSNNEGYYATGGGAALYVKGGPKKSWFNFFFS